MKLNTFQVLLISLPFIWSARYCALTKFEPKLLFDTDIEHIELQTINYHVNDRADAPCFVSFHVADLTKSHTTFKSVSECANLFTGDGHVVAHWFGNANYVVDDALKQAGCYYQYNWVFCVCFHNYCNAPQYWSLLLSTFYHSRIDKGRTGLTALADTLLSSTGPLGAIIQKSNFRDIIVDKTADSFPSQLKCLMWFADTVGQVNLDSPFYLFNYITERVDAPPVDINADPRLKNANDSMTPQEFYYETKPEPFSVEARDKRNAEIVNKIEDMDGMFVLASVFIGGASIIGFFSTFGVTAYLLSKFCQSLQNESQFSRNTSTKSRLRYEALIYPDTVPIEFQRGKNKGGNSSKKSSDKKGKEAKGEKSTKEKDGK